MDSLEEYKAKGVIKISGVFSEEECNRIKEEAYSIKDTDILEAGYNHSPSEYRNGIRSLVFFPAIENSYLNEIRIDDRLASLAKAFIGDNVKQINNQIYFREAGDGDQFAWHRDIIFRESNNFRQTVVDDYFQTIIAIDDITKDNGAIEFIEGSHLWDSFPKPQDLRQFDRNGLKGTKYTAKKGDVLIWSVNIVHGSEPNISTRDRMTYMNGFCRSNSVDNYPNYLINGTIVPNISVTEIP
jgi:ectoine hydroxylase-related dioxygenase (phytanoyl-CoA dioxygenase family)